MITPYTQDYMLRLKAIMANQYAVLPKNLQDPAVHTAGTAYSCGRVRSTINT